MMINIYMLKSSILEGNYTINKRSLTAVYSVIKDKTVW